MSKILSRFLGNGLRASFLERKQKSVQAIAPEDGDSREATPTVSPAEGSNPFGAAAVEAAGSPSDGRSGASTSQSAVAVGASGGETTLLASASGSVPAPVNVPRQTPSPPPSPAPVSPKQPHPDDLSDDRSDVLVDLPAPTLPVDWSKGNKLGSGSFGQVYQGLNNRTGAWQRAVLEQLTPTLRQMGRRRSIVKKLCIRKLGRCCCVQMDVII